MSMIYNLHQASDETITTLLAKPRLIHMSIGLEDSPPPLSIWQRVGTLLKKKSVIADFTHEVDLQREPCYLDKSWHGIHYLLSRTDWEGELPEAFLLSGGTAVGDIDVGYGPARAFTSAETTEIHACLSVVPGDTLRSRFDAEAMAALKIYPDIWEEEQEEALDYILDYYDTLRAFLAEAHRSECGMVVYIG